MSTSVPLSTIRPDYESLRSQLQQKLASKGAWQDVLPTTTGQALIDFVASIGAFDQFSIESVLQEEFFDTQKFNSSTFAKARTLGARLGRKIPAHVKVRLMQDSMNPVGYVPAYSTFEANGRTLYNREAIVFDVPQKDVILYCGSVRSLTTTASGTNFQKFISEERDFRVSDSDMLVLVDGVEIDVTKRGLWHYRDTPAVRDETNAKGQLVLLFGNDYFGTNPRQGSIVALTYCVCSGAADNDSTFAGHEVKGTVLDTVKGTTLSGLVGGADQIDATTYKNIAPHIYSAGDKSITHPQYNAQAAGYPGVIDALIVGQRYIAPFDRRYMNLLRVSLLTTTPWTPEDWSAFCQWFYATTMSNLELYEELPKPRKFETDADIVCKPTADLDAVKVAATNALLEFYALGHGSIGRKIYVSHIYDVLKACHEDIQHINLKSPTFNILPNLRIEGLKGDIVAAVDSPVGAGTLGQTSVSYWVTAVSGTGPEQVESLPEQVDVTILNAGEVPYIRWDAHPYADYYKVYGRTKSSMGLLVEQTTSTFFYDNGTAVPVAGSYPLVDETGVYYPENVKLSLATRYSRDTVRM